MKKLFISVPMRGRTEENIRASYDKLQAFAELVVGEKLERIVTYVEDHPPKTTHESLWYLSKSIEKMADADVFVGIGYCEGMWPGCEVEENIARRYGIRTVVLREELWSQMLPDAWEIYRHRWDNEEKVCAANAEADNG